MSALLDLQIVVQPLLLGIDWMDPNWLLERFGAELFWISMIIVFVECGLFFPILPGDTLLFALGLFIATGQLDLFPGPPFVELLIAVAMLIVAAFLGNVVGYEIGRKLGPPLYERDGRIIKRKYFDQTTAFFDKHGNKALVIGRFVPFVRTYITVVAGVTRMDRARFFLWSFVGAVLWVSSICLARLLPRRRVPPPGREHRQGDHRDPVVLADPDPLRVVAAQAHQRPRGRDRPAGRRPGPRHLRPQHRLSPVRLSSAAYGVQLRARQHRPDLQADVGQWVLAGW